MNSPDGQMATCDHSDLPIGEQLLKQCFNRIQRWGSDCDSTRCLKPQLFIGCLSWCADKENGQKGGCVLAKGIWRKTCDFVFPPLSGFFDP